MESIFLAAVLLGQPCVCDVPPAYEPAAVAVVVERFQRRRPVLRVLGAVGRFVSRCRLFHRRYRCE